MSDDLYYRRLSENPFHILDVSPGHGIGAIREREAAIQLSHGPALAAWAVEQLLHPRNRLEAELGWVHDVPEDLVEGLVIGIEERSLEEIIAKCGDLGALDRITIAMDLIASRRPDIGLTPLPWLVSGWDHLEADPYLARINEMRASAGEAALDGAAFAAGLLQLRDTQASFVEELMMRGGGVADEALKAVAMSFVLGESGRLPDMSPGEAAPPAAADVPSAPATDMRTPDPRLADGEGFGLFDEATEEEAALGEDSDFASQALHPQDGYQDQDVISAIMGRQDEDVVAADPTSEEDEPSLPARRKSRLLPAVAAGMLVAVVIGVSLVPGADEGPQRLAHGDGQPTLVLGQPQVSDMKEPAPTQVRTSPEVTSSMESIPAPEVAAIAAPGADATPPLGIDEPAVPQSAEADPAVAPRPASREVLPDAPRVMDELPRLRRPSASLNPDPAPSPVTKADADMPVPATASRPEPPMDASQPDAAPMAQLAPPPPARPAPRLQLRRPPHGNDDRMSIEEIRYCHVEFMILERLPEFVESEAAGRAMLFRALEHVSRCEGGSRLQSDMDQVAHELRSYDFAADAASFARN